MGCSLSVLGHPGACYSFLPPLSPEGGRPGTKEHDATRRKVYAAGGVVGALLRGRLLCSFPWGLWQGPIDLLVDER